VLGVKHIGVGEKVGLLGRSVMETGSRQVDSAFGVSRVGGSLKTLAVKANAQ
jgi:hypothetical protein